MRGGRMEMRARTEGDEEEENILLSRITWNGS